MRQSLLMGAILPAILLSAQHEPAKKTAPHFAITAPAPAKTFTLGGAEITSATIAQTVSENLSTQLASRKFVPVKPLDVQCCNVQVQIVDASALGNHLSLTVKLTVQDIDQQFIYAKEYRATAPMGPRQLATAASEIARSALSDLEFLKALSPR